jgi:pyruvate/2-oxoglutarate/acetoin dehydrogenase E1 component
MKYIDLLKQKMEELAKLDNTIFLGQAVQYPGTALYYTVKDIPANKTLEMPVAENMQMGISTGLALNGFLPISIFPRWNFLISATDQLVNHLDKLKEMSRGEFNPKVIIRVGVGSQTPLYPGPQHVGDFTQAFRKMLTTIPIWQLETRQDIEDAYNVDFIFKLSCSIILVEYMDLYNIEL